MVEFNYAKIMKMVKNRSENLYIIHYSCASLYDENLEPIPRVAAIVVMNFATKIPKEFTLHKSASKLGVEASLIAENLDDLERDLLQEYAKYISDKSNCYWFNWGMRGLRFGFEHLEHRYHVLTNEKMIEIQDDKRINIVGLISYKHGKKFADVVGRMEDLMKLNNYDSNKFLTGRQEFFAYKNKEFIKMHDSTLSKVSFFEEVLSKLSKGTLITRSPTFSVKIKKIAIFILQFLGKLSAKIISKLFLWFLFRQ